MIRKYFIKTKFDDVIWVITIRIISVTNSLTKLITCEDLLKNGLPHFLFRRPTILFACTRVNYLRHGLSLTKRDVSRPLRVLENLLQPLMMALTNNHDMFSVISRSTQLVFWYEYHLFMWNIIHDVDRLLHFVAKLTKVHSLFQNYY